MLLYQIAFSLLFEKRNRIALQWLEQYGSAVEAWKHLTEKGMGEAMARAERELAFVETHPIGAKTKSILIACGSAPTDRCCCSGKATCG